MEELTQEHPEDTVTAEAAYRYERSDGTVEYASNAEDVIKRCPVIGRIALESPERANNLMALAAFGAEPLAPPLKKETKSDSEPIVDHPKQEVTPQHPTRAESVPEIPLKAPTEIESLLVNPPHSITETILPVDALREDTVIVNADLAPNKEMPSVDTPPVAQVREAMVQTSPVEKVVSTPETTAEAVIVKPVENVTETQVELGIEMFTTTAELLLSEPGERPEPPSGAEPMMSGASIASKEVHDTILETTIPIVYEVTASDVTLEAYDHEIVAVYTELLASMPSKTVEIVFESSFEAEVEYPSEITAEEPLTLEMIQHDAASQPLAITLKRFEHFIASKDIPEQRYQINDVLAVIDGALFRNESEEFDHKKVIQVTPELVVQLMQLLRLLGYDEPRKALNDYLRTQGIEALLQSLATVCQIHPQQEHHDSKVERMAHLHSVPANDDGVRQRVGKLLFGLISKLQPEPVS